MTRALQIILPLLAIILFSPIGLCATPETAREPWEKFSLNVGAFVTNVNSSVRLGSGIGISIEPEELLGLDSSSQVFRIDGSWRFTENRKHRLNLSWFSFRRSGSKIVGKDIIIEDPTSGKSVEIPAGSLIEGHLDLDIYQLAYSYSFLQDDRIDLAAELGLYVMPIDIGYAVSGLVDGSGSGKFTAPLPTVGFRMDVQLAPNWFLRSSSKIFYLEYQNFTGSIISFQGAVEYNPWEHVGFGVGFDTFKLRIKANGEDYPSIDFKGDLEYGYNGLQLYGRVFF